MFTATSGRYVCDGVGDGEQEVYADLPTGEWGRATVILTRGTTARLDV